MKGFMRRRGPSWELRVYLGRDRVTGRKRYATRSVRGSKRRADGVLRDMVAAAEVGVTHRAGAFLGELCETWLSHASGHLAANTVAETRRLLDRTLLPALGDVPLPGLRPEHLDALYGGSTQPGTAPAALACTSLHPPKDWSLRITRGGTGCLAHRAGGIPGPDRPPVGDHGLGPGAVARVPAVAARRVVTLISQVVGHLRFRARPRAPAW